MKCHGLNFFSEKNITSNWSKIKIHNQSQPKKHIFLVSIKYLKCLYSALFMHLMTKSIGNNL